MTQKRKAASPRVPAFEGKAALEQQKNQRNNIIIHADSQLEKMFTGPVTTTAAAQRRRILEHLKHDTLTTLQARSIGIMHPAARCMELRKQGHLIVTEKAYEYCPGGVRHRVARYRLEHSAEAPRLSPFPDGAEGFANDV